MEVKISIHKQYIKPHTSFKVNSLLFCFQQLIYKLHITELKHDTSDDATWQAGENNLQHPALQRNIDHDSNRINHYAFLTGSDRKGPISSAYVGTVCFNDQTSKLFIFIQILYQSIYHIHLTAGALFSLHYLQ